MVFKFGTTPMARVTLCLLFLLLVLSLQQSDAVSDKCNKLEQENDRLEKDITRVTAQKHQYEQFYGQCNENLTLQIHTMQSNSRKLKETEEVNSYLKTTIDCLTNTVQSFNQTEHGLREKEEQLQVTIDDLTKTEEANNRTAQEFREKQKQMQATIDVLTKTVGTNNRTVQELFEKQKQMQATIDVLTKTMNHKFKMMCGQPKTACRYLIQAIESGDVRTVRNLAGCTDDSCTTDDFAHYPPLNIAAEKNNLEVVRVLVEGGANLDTANIKYLWTPLHEAAWNGNVDICRLLLDGGAKLDPVNHKKQTPLNRAAANGHLSVVQLLVLKGANVSLKDEDGKTASGSARGAGKRAVADWLDSVGRA